MNTNYEKNEERRKEGSLTILHEQLKEYNQNLELKEVVKHAPEYIARIRHVKRRMIMKDYYIHNRSVLWIRYNYGFNSFSDVERMLRTGVKELSKMY